MIEDFKANYEPRLTGYLIEHTYQWADSQRTSTFRIDTAYNVVKRK